MQLEDGTSAGLRKPSPPLLCRFYDRAVGAFLVDVIATRPLSRTDTRSLVYVAALGAAAVYFLIFPIWRGQFLVEIWPTESWNAYWQDAVSRGLPLYPDPTSLVGNNYPPLSFYGVALFGKLFAMGNLQAGRALSIVALVLLAIEITGIVKILAGSTFYGALGGLWYLAIMARNSTIYVGADDPQLAGLAIMGAGLWWFLDRVAAERDPTPALLLMVVAGFWKHNNIAIPLTCISWLLITRNRFAVRGVMISGAAALAGLGLCITIYGPNFLPNMLATRSYGMGTLLANIGHLQWIALALFIWLFWALSSRRTAAARFTMLHVGFGLFACLLQWLGHGVSGNAEFDLILAAAIGIGAAFAGASDTLLSHRVGPDRLRDIMVAALLLRLLASDRQETALLFLSDDFRASLRGTETNLRFEASKVAIMPGNVECKTKLICRQAGKPFVVDEFKVEEMLLTGKATPQSIAEKMAAAGITTFNETLPATAQPKASLIYWLKNRH
ncbi:hypothetical protein [Bradyrhizobium canariense]|uniref:hypothetical protein n=1 Tax=Bradyrhizobium canariense TaxID=255045 RepID=UPI001178AA34|nr:hypothetical protein [Bradyrhizobium canariense]